jgi:hypothetical protein
MNPIQNSHGWSQYESESLQSGKFSEFFVSKNFVRRFFQNVKTNITVAMIGRLRVNVTVKQMKKLIIG